MSIADTDLWNLFFVPSGQGTPTFQRSIYFPTAPNPGPVVCRYNGNQLSTLPSGTVLQLTDLVYPQQFGWREFPPNTTFNLICDIRWVGAGSLSAFVGMGTANAGGLDGGFGAYGANSTAGFVNVVTTAPGAIACNTPFTRAPIAVLGIPAAPHMAVLGHGDSLQTSCNVANGDLTSLRGVQSWFARGLANINGNQIPWTNLAINANASTNIVGNPTALQLLAALAPYFTHYIADFGHNALGTPAAEFARNTIIWNTLLNTPGSRIRHIEHVAMMPQTASGFPITSITSVGTLCTVTAPGAQYLANGMGIYISGATDSAYNAFGATISNVTVAGASSTFQYTATSTPASSPASGTINGNDVWATGGGGAGTGNQTPSSGFEPNGTSGKDVWNALLLANVSPQGPLNGVFKHNSIEPTLGYWRTNGTNFGYTGSTGAPDGTHFNTGGYQVAGPEFAAYVAARWH